MAVRVTYWAGRGVCEPARLLLAAASVPFENIFIEARDDFVSLTQAGKLDYGQLPLIEMDGLNMIQSGCQFRYIAKKYDLMGSDSKEEYFVDSISESCKDARYPFVQWQFNQHKVETLKKFQAERYCGKWNDLLKESNASYFLPSGPSAADVAVFETLEFLQIVFGENDRKGFDKFLSSYPFLVEHFEKTREIGDIDDYIKNHRNHILDYHKYATLVCDTQSVNFLKLFAV